MTHTVTVEELKADVAKCLDEVRRGNTLQITEGKVPFADMTPASGLVFLNRADASRPLKDLKLEPVGDLGVDLVEALLEERRKDRR